MLKDKIRWRFFSQFSFLLITAKVLVSPQLLLELSETHSKSIYVKKTNSMLSPLIEQNQQQPMLQKTAHPHRTN